MRFSRALIALIAAVPAAVVALLEPAVKPEQTVCSYRSRADILHVQPRVNPQGPCKNGSSHHLHHHRDLLQADFTIITCFMRIYTAVIEGYRRTCVSVASESTFPSRPVY